MHILYINNERFEMYQTNGFKFANILSNVAVLTPFHKYILVLSLVGSTICCFEYTVKEDVQKHKC